MQAQLIHKPLFRTWHPIRRLVILIAAIAFLVGAVTAFGGFSGTSTHLSSWKGNLQTTVCDHLKVWCSGAPTPGASTSQTPVSSLGTDVPTPVGPAPAAGPATFVFAFKDFHDHAPTLVGDALINESTNNGIATQITTNGMLVYDHKSGHSFLIRNDHTVWVYFDKVTQQVR